MTDRIAFQGEPGAYSHQACHATYPGMEVLPCRTFEDTIAAVRDGTARLAMVPVENSTFGRVADIHHLLPSSGLHIVGEAFVRVHINLLALPGVRLDQIESAMSHTMLLGQCRAFLERHGIHRVAGADTAGSARHVAEAGDPSMAALASELAGEIYGLDVVAAYRGSQHQHHAFPGDGSRARFLAARRERDDDHAGLPPALDSRRALQGAGRLRHQRRQHDQAGKLHDRR